MRCIAAAVVLLLVLLSAVAGNVRAQTGTAVSQTTVELRPRLLSPDISGLPVRLRPRIRWTSVPGATAYIVQAAPDSTFSVPAVADTLGTDTSAVPGLPLAPGTVYHWRVGVVLSDGVTLFSDTVRAATVRPPAATAVRIPDSRRDEETVAFTYIRNDAPFPVTIDSSGGHPRLVARTALPTVLGAGDSILVRFGYRPRTFGDERDTLRLFTEAGDVAVPFTARCSPPILAARSVGILLGPVAVNDSAAGILEFTNAGPFNKLTVRRVRTRTQFFSASFLPVRTLEPGEILRIPVKFHIRAFKPDAFGTYTDTCLVESDGGLARVVLTGESPSPRAWVEPPVLSFGDVAALDTAMATVRVMNRSVNELRIDSVGNGSKSLCALFGRTKVGRSDTAALSFRFVAGRYGTFTDTVTLGTNSWWGPVRIPVIARIPWPVLQTGVDRIDFGAVRKNDTAGVVVRIANGSPSALRVDSIRTRTRAFRFNPPSLPRVVQRGDTLAVTLYFFPDSVRHFSDTLVIGSNAGGPPKKIPLSGNGIPPGAVTGRSATPGEFELFQNFPNPFRGATTFRYALPEPGHVRFEIFTTLGQQVVLLVDGEQDAGYHNVTWNATVTSGVYYYRLVATPRSDPSRQFKGTRKMIIMR